MSDPSSLLAALNKCENPDTARHSGISVTESQADSAADSSAADSVLGNGNNKSGRARDIRLPGALAGLVAGDDGEGGGTVNNDSNGGFAGRNKSTVDSTGGVTQKRRGPLISEILPASDPEVVVEREGAGSAGGAGGVGGEKEGGTRTSSIKKRRSGRGGGSVVKKGFLSKVGKGGASPLYPPEGSENGSEPSSYAKLMGRCKVVDTTTMNKQEVR